MPQIFDRALYYRRQARARAKPTSAEAAGALFAPVLAALDERLALAGRDFQDAAILEAQHLAHHPMPQLQARTQQRIGLFGGAGGAGSDAPSPLLHATRPMPHEQLSLAAHSQDLIVALWGLHIVNDVPSLLAQIRGALKPDGLFLAALAGGESLSGLRLALLKAEAACAGGAAARIHPFADILHVGDALSRAGFVRTVVDRELLPLKADGAALIAQLRALGESNCMVRRAPLRRDVLAQACALLPREEAPPQLELHYLSGWTPAEKNTQRKILSSNNRH